MERQPEQRETASNVTVSIAYDGNERLVESINQASDAETDHHNRNFGIASLAVTWITKSFNLNSIKESVVGRALKEILFQPKVEKEQVISNILRKRVSRRTLLQQTLQIGLSTSAAVALLENFSEIPIEQKKPVIEQKKPVLVKEGFRPTREQILSSIEKHNKPLKNLSWQLRLNTSFLKP